MRKTSATYKSIKAHRNRDESADNKQALNAQQPDGTPDANPDLPNDSRMFNRTFEQGNVSYVFEQAGSQEWQEDDLNFRDSSYSDDSESESASEEQIINLKKDESENEEEQEPPFYMAVLT